MATRNYRQGGKIAKPSVHKKNVRRTAIPRKHSHVIGRSGQNREKLSYLPYTMEVHPEL